MGNLKLAVIVGNNRAEIHQPEAGGSLVDLVADRVEPAFIHIDDLPSTMTSRASGRRR